MKLRFKLGIMALGLAVASQQAVAEETVKLNTEKDKISYSIGMDIGNSFKGRGMDVDIELVYKGLEHSFNGKETAVSLDESRKILMEYGRKMREKEMAKSSQSSDANKQEGDAFLAGNGKKDGVVTLPSGLQYKVIEKGDGASPSIDDTVETHYRGTLIDGTEFDSSYKRGQPAVFPVKGVIAGWTEALQLMKVGAKWQLFIPSDLAYGERGSMPKIGPNSTLIFDIELLGVK